MSSEVKDLLVRIVDAIAAALEEIVDRLGDTASSLDLMQRAGLSTPPGASPDTQGASSAIDALRAKTATEGQDPIAIVQQLSAVMTDVVALVQQTANVNDADDAWNLIATYLDLVGVDRLREREPEALAVLSALHLLSEDRLLIADLIRSGDQWGRFVLGDPGDDDLLVDGLSLILGAVLVWLGKYIPMEDDSGKRWLLDMMLGWDPEPVGALPHVTRVLQRIMTLRLQHLDTISGDQLQENVGLSAVWVPKEDGGVGLFLALDVGGQVSFPIGSTLELVLTVDSPDALEAFLGPSPFVRTGLGATTGTVLLRRKQEVAEHWNLGQDGSTHLEIGTFETGLKLQDPPAFVFGIGDGALVIPQDAIGFLSKLLPSGGMKLTFDVELSIDTTGKIKLTGGAGMTVVVPVNAKVLGVTVRAVTVALTLKDDAGSLAATVGFSVDFWGALVATVDGIGAKLTWSLPSSPTPVGGAPVAHGNLGPLGDLSWEFVPPTGIGIQIGVDPIKGGGFLFFDPPHRTYGGVLEAKAMMCGLGLDIKAAGLLRETDDGFDFVLIATVELHPAPRVLGLSLSGLGAMVGINVAVDVNQLRGGVHDGAMSRLLFPDDPVANAPAIIATMGGVFPHRAGGRVVGLLLQLGFGEPDPLVTLSLALVVAWPNPALLLLLGSLRIALPTKDLAVVSLRVDFLGVFDLATPTYSIDGSLVDSRLATFPITGDMTARAGAQAFVISLGGYHPNFHPTQTLPTLRRLAIDISPNPLMKIRTESYLAVTSNTIQLGLHADLDIDAGVASLHGWLDFDALLQRKPKVWFSVEVAIGLELRVGGSSWAGVSVDLLLEGPGPWHAKGDASLHLLFFTVHAGFDTTWGDDDTVALPPATDAGALVAAALAEDGAWAAVGADAGAAITMRPDGGGGLRLHPDGQVRARQQQVPIGVPITRVGTSAVVGGTTTVQLTASGLQSAPSTGQFAVAQFVDLSDDELLARPSFEPFQDGLVFGPTVTVLSAEQPTTAAYETVFVPDQARPVRQTLPVRLLAHALLTGAVARSGLHVATLYDGARQTVSLADPGYRVVSAGTLAGVAAAPQAFATATAATAAAAAIGRRVLVVGDHEVV